MKSFDTILNEVMDKYNFNNWWEVIDGDYFDEVVENILVNRGFYVRQNDDRLEIAINHIEGFMEWYEELCADL